MSEMETRERHAPDDRALPSAPGLDPVPASGARQASEPPGTAPDPARRPVNATTLTRRGRVRKWDRPPSPRDWRWYVGGLGKTLIAVGLLMFGFVAYQLWGTAIETAAAQNELDDEFTELLAAATPPPFEAGPDGEVTPVVTDPVTGVEPDPVTNPGVPPAVVPVVDQNIPDWENGDALARIEIPRIGVDDIVVAGVETRDLKKGPGHFPDTPLPGQLGNAAIAGHRTTYGQPFRNVDQLEPGDEIRVTTLNGVFVYRVTGQQIVSPSDYQVVSTTDPTRATLTLTSCHPVFTAQQRIIIFSELDAAASGPVGEPILNYGRPAEPSPSGETSTDDGDDQAGVDDPTVIVPAPDGDGTGTATGTLDDIPSSAVDQLGTDEVNSSIADAFSESWFSDPSANPHVGLWGLALAAISIAAYWVSRKLRRDWVGLLVGIGPFAVTLYFFFQNVNRLLPPNL